MADLVYSFLCYFIKGLIFNEFNGEYKVNRTLALTILKEFGFGNHNVMQNRILLELERLVAIRYRCTGRYGLPYT